MTSTNPDPRIGGYRHEVDHQKLGPALLIASSLVLAIRTARWSPTLSDGLSNVEWDKEVKHNSDREGRPISFDRTLSRALSNEAGPLVCRYR